MSFIILSKWMVKTEYFCSDQALSENEKSFFYFSYLQKWKFDEAYKIMFSVFGFMLWNKLMFIFCTFVYLCISLIIIFKNWNLIFKKTLCIMIFINKEQFFYILYGFMSKFAACIHCESSLCYHKNTETNCIHILLCNFFGVWFFRLSYFMCIKKKCTD